MCSLKEDLNQLSKEDNELFRRAVEKYKGQIVGQSHIYTCSNRLKAFPTLTLDQRTKLRLLMESDVEKPRKPVHELKIKEFISYDDYKDSYD